MPTATHKQRILQRLLNGLKRSAEPETTGRPVLEHLIYGVCREGTSQERADQAFRNLSTVLEAGGSSMDRVVKVTIFLTDMAANFPKVVDLRRKWFTPPYPADTIVQVQSLYRPEVMLEIEAIAVV